MGGINGLRPPARYTRVVRMALAMAGPWKHPKTGIYRFRKGAPDELQKLLGSTRKGRGSERATRRRRSAGF